LLAGIPKDGQINPKILINSNKIYPKFNFFRKFLQFIF